MMRVGICHTAVVIWHTARKVAYLRGQVRASGFKGGVS